MAKDTNLVLRYFMSQTSHINEYCSSLKSTLKIFL